MTPTPSAGYTVHYYLFSCELVLNLALELKLMWKGHLLKLECTHSPLNLRILSLTSFPFTLTTVQVPNLALTHTKQIQCRYRKRKWNFTLPISEQELYFSHLSDNIFNPILHTWFRDSCLKVVLYVMVPQPYGLSLCCLHRYGKLTILEFFSKWLKVMLPYREGGGLPVMGGGVSLMTHSTGSVTTHSKTFKYMIVCEPYRYTLYF